MPNNGKSMANEKGKKSRKKLAQKIGFYKYEKSVKIRRDKSVKKTFLKLIYQIRHDKKNVETYQNDFFQLQIRQIKSKSPSNQEFGNLNYGLKSAQLLNNH